MKQTNLISLLILTSFLGMYAMEEHIPMDINLSEEMTTSSEEYIPMDVDLSEEMTTSSEAMTMAELKQELDKAKKAKKRAKVATESLENVSSAEFEQRYGKATFNFEELAVRWKDFYEFKIRQLNPKLVKYFRLVALQSLLTNKKNIAKVKLGKDLVYYKNDLYFYDDFIKRWLPNYKLFSKTLLGDEPIDPPWKIQASRHGNGIISVAT